MRTRAKVLTVATAMVTTFAILPTLGAAAADTLEDGTYEIVVDQTTYTVEVVDGIPVIDTLEGTEFAFEFDDETGRVLDEFDLTIDGLVYEIEIADDGTVEVTVDEDGHDEDGDDELDDELDDLSDDELDDELDPAIASDTHGELVSTVAHCAPTGVDAREADLPNHGFFVSAAAQGDSVDFTVDGATHSADLSTLAGAQEFCSLVDDLLMADDEGDAPSEDSIVTDEPVDETDEPVDETDEPDEETDEPDEETDEPDGETDESAETDEGELEETDEPDDAASEDDETVEEDETTEQNGTNAAERSYEARNSSNDNG